MNPAPLALPEFTSRIQAGNFDDDFDKLGQMDWICEVIIEKWTSNRPCWQKLMPLEKKEP